jgi:lactoylglutathione lyase
MTLRGRYVHTMIHVADLERSIDFYTRIMGMSVLRRGEMPAPQCFRRLWFGG